MIRIYNQHDFLHQYESFFLEDEIRYVLILGITRRNTGITLLIASEIDNRFIVGVLAGKNLIIASNTLQEDGYCELVQYMEDIDYPGIIGVKEQCEIYHKIYLQKTGTSLLLKMDQRIYSCQQIQQVSTIEGTIRLAEETEVNLLAEWAYEFTIGINEFTTKEEAIQSVKQKIENKSLYVLEQNGILVSMAARVRPLNSTESIGYVFTPKEYRRNGYASRLVEEITRMIFRDEKTATLYTDLSNPTSNSIYMKIGYVPYCDSVMLNK